MGFVSSLFLVDCGYFEPPMPLQSHARLDLAFFSMDYNTFGLLMPVRSFAWSGFPPSILDFVKVDPLMFLHNAARLDFSLLVLRTSRLDLIASIFGDAAVDLSLPSRSPACLGPVLPILEFAKVDSFISLRSYG